LHGFDINQTKLLLKTELPTTEVVIFSLQVVIMRSLKMGLPKVVPAEISKGCRFRFPCIDTEFQQAKLKGHSKKR